MKKLKIKLSGDGTNSNPYHVNIPTYQIMEIKDKIATVEVPDDEINSNTGKLDKNKIRHKYRGQSKWDRQDVTDDIIYV